MQDSPLPDPLPDRIATLPGCDLVVMLDLDAQTVLESRSRLRHPQERLDAVAAWAAGMLGDGVPLAVTAGDTALRLAFRIGDGADATEACCVVLHPGADPGAVLALVPRQGA
jgi:hypothetical protein